VPHLWSSNAKRQVTIGSEPTMPIDKLGLQIVNHMGSKWDW
jgi:hypothetical protein